MPSVQFLQASRAQRSLDVWWMQWILGLACVVVALVPWIASGGGAGTDSAVSGSSAVTLLPHGALQPTKLLTLVGFSALLSGFISRLAGRGGLKFSLLTGLGLLCGWLGAGYQSWSVLQAADRLTSVHAWTVSAATLVALLLHWVIARLDLALVVVAVAVLGFAVGGWLEELLQPFPMQLPIEFAGPVLLGLALGFLGFDRASSLLLWCFALALQWLIPPGLLALGQAVIASGDMGGAWESAMRDALTPSALHQALASLATAMLVSVVLLVVRRIRARR